MTENEIRKVIYVDELNIEEKRAEERAEMEDKTSKYLSEVELKNKLDSYKGRLPSIVLRDLYELLKGRRLTEEQVDKIVSRVEEKLRSRIQFNAEELYAKINKIERMIEKLASSHNGSSIDKEMEMEKKAVVSEFSEENLQPQISKDKSMVLRGDELAMEMNNMERIDYQASPVRKEVKQILFGTEKPDHMIKTAQVSVRLESIPQNPRSMMFLLKWIEYMIERVGYTGLEDVLDYYVDIGWITEDVMFDILKFAKGVKLYHESSDWRPVGYMNVQDHIMSLMFIEALKTGRMEKDTLNEVERQVYRIKKGVSEINGI